jgi:hypothetical protein
MSPSRTGGYALVFISWRAMLKRMARVYFSIVAATVVVAFLHDSRGRNTASRYERDRRHGSRLANPSRTDQER